VKLVILTAAGVRTRERLRAGMYEPPPELVALSSAALKALEAATSNLPAGKDDADS
jgi:hypothetical protein